VFTAHNAVPRAPRRGQLAATRRLLERMDAVVVHSQHGAGRVHDAFGVPRERLHVIPHGAFDHLTRLPEESPLPEELAAVEGPVALFFGTLRPYKGVELLLEAFASVDAEAELWVVGLPHLPVEPLREIAARAPGTVRFVPRFVTDPEIPAYFRRADVVVLPYREIDQSGVLYTALAFGKAILATSVGGFTEAAEEHGLARLVAPEDPPALGAALSELLGSEGERERLSAAARAAAEGPYSWDAVGRQTLALYQSLLV
jgi:glycosyltransferase involved in cell wall biosynthesis